MTQFATIKHYGGDKVKREFIDFFFWILLVASILTN